MSMEEGKEASPPSRPNQARVLPLKLLRLFLAFLFIGLGVSLASMYMLRYLGIKDLSRAEPTLVMPCFEEPPSLERWVRPPVNLLHSMNDSQLLWRASFATPMENYPFDRVPKVAFMFLAKGALPLAPLWERYLKNSKGFYSVYVHSLPLYVADFSPSSVFYKRQIPSQVSRWGEISMCEAERRLLANALLDLSNEWFILISESCIPIRNFNTLYSYLLGTNLSFMGSYDDPSPTGRGRYNHRMSPLVNVSNWRKGAQWFQVNRKLALDIVKDTVYYPKFRDFCKPACYADEHYFQTMLTLQSPRLLANRNLHFVDWSRGGAHPATFGKGDVHPGFFKWIFKREKCTYNGEPTSLCYFFARKFSPDALKPLMEVAWITLDF